MTLETVHDIVKTWSISASSFLLSINLDTILDWFGFANTFFNATDAIWKNLLVIATIAYTIKKIFYEKKDK